MKVTNKVIVVTGGGNGIGREVVLNLLLRGAKVAAVDVNQAALEETAKLAGTSNDRLSTHIVNLADRKAVESLPEQVLNCFNAVDGIVNNAGIIQPFVNVQDLDYDKIKMVMDINFYGTLYMVKSFLPYLLNRPEAHIVNISSMGGFLPVPGQSVYGASKAAVKLLTEGLQSELKGTNVGVSVIFPGGVSTNIMENSGVAGSRAVDTSQSNINQLLTPKGAAEIIIEAMEHKRPRVFAGKDSKLLNIYYRLSPGKASDLIAKKLKY